MGEREATNSAPGECGHEVGCLIPFHRSCVTADPAGGCNLGQALEGRTEQQSFGFAEIGVLGDHCGDATCDLRMRAIDAGAHILSSNHVTLEEKSVDAIGGIHESEIRPHRLLHAHLVVGGGSKCDIGGCQEFIDGGVEDGEVEVEFAIEMLIEHRFGDPRSLGYLFHGGRVESAMTEHIACRRQDLLAALFAGKACPSRCRFHHSVTLVGLASPSAGMRTYPDDVIAPGPFPGTEIVLPDRTLHVRSSERSDLPAAMFIHGLGGSALNWTDLMFRMRDEVNGYAVDLGGFGLSPPPRDGDMSPRAHAESVVSLIDHMGIAPVHLFGNSFGGAVALNLAARYPGLIRSLTLISPALPSLYATKGNMHLPMIAIPGVGERLMPKFLQAQAAERIQMSIQANFADPQRLPQARVAEAVAELEKRDGLPYVPEVFLRTLRSLLKTYVDRGPDRPWKLAERVMAPTLLIYGRKDPLVDARSGHRATSVFPNAHVVVLPDSGHVAQMEHPEFVKAAWDRFIARETTVTTR